MTAFLFITILLNNPEQYCAVAHAYSLMKPTAQQHKTGGFWYRPGGYGVCGLAGGESQFCCVQGGVFAARCCTEALTPGLSPNWRGEERKGFNAKG
jgi:hypothetical protein